MKDTASSLMAELFVLTIFHQRNPDVLEKEISETCDVLRKKIAELTMGLTVKPGPYEGFWVVDGDKVVAWFADEAPAKKYAEDTCRS